MEMKGTPWSDGVPGVTQLPIAPGRDFTHRFTATQHGNYWYHSHARGQIEDGLYGAIFIRPCAGTDNPFHLISAAEEDVVAMVDAEHKSKVVALYDLMHITSEEKHDITLASGIEIPCYDRILFNGKGRVHCYAPAELEANLTPPQKADLVLAPGETLTDRGYEPVSRVVIKKKRAMLKTDCHCRCFPPKVMATFGGNQTRFNESAIPHHVFYECANTTDPVETIQAEQNAWISLNILGATNFHTGVFSIDEHDMWVYAVDGGYIEPQRVQAITVSNGERYSVLVKPTGAGDFRIRHVGVTAPQTITGYAVLSVCADTSSGVVPAWTPYETDKPWVSITGVPLSSSSVTMYSDVLARPYPAEPIPERADALHVLNMKKDGASYLWAMNSTRLEPEQFEGDAPPLLFRQPDAQVSNNNVTLLTRNNTWIDLVLYASKFPMPPHPVHKHGNKMYMIGAGRGDFTWMSVEEAVKEVPDQFNLVNPLRRDTWVTLPAVNSRSWMVVRYHVSNPGAWLLHCHISNHMVGGMTMVILDGVDEWPVIPDEYLNYH